MKNIKQLLWPVFGVAYGLLMRILFDNDFFDAEIISIAFMLGTPFVIGAIVVYGVRSTNPSILKMIFLPWLGILLTLLGTLLALLEGLICIFLALPLFLIISSIGGLIMGLVLRWSNKGKATLNSFLLLPIALLAFEPNSQQPRLMEERVSVEVKASPERIWDEILNAKDIKKEELPLNLTHLIGVPRPIEGINKITSQGEIRSSKWERGVNFKAIVTQKDDYRSITWRYEFDKNSFPKGSMDDHVEIGGKYLDLYDTTFNLSPISQNLTKLEIISHYSVTTRINFYGIPVTRIIAHDFMSAILHLYKTRSERNPT